MLSIFPKERSRWLTHLGLAVLTIVWSYGAFQILPDDYKNVHVLTIATGYIALFFLIITLLIGPFQLILKKRKQNPVNINLRRDIGIWAALTGLVHVVFGFQIHLQGQLIRYFFNDIARWQPQLNLFGASNYLGAVATIILILLLLLSNDISLRWLRGKLWKNLQRFNYGLFILVLAHTLGYQLVVDRAPIIIIIVILSTLLLLVFQTIGYALTRKRRRS